MTPEQKHLCALIEGHCAAMKAQVVDLTVRVEYLADCGDWATPLALQISFTSNGPCGMRWLRLAPVPRLIPLDQSDFLGERRVTHLRNTAGIFAIAFIADDGIYLAHNAQWLHFCKMEHWQCSRDNGATWSKCEKEAKA